MVKRNQLGLFGLVLLTGSVGCMPTMTIEQMKAMTPERPAELDLLNMIAGRWEVTGTMNFTFLEDALETTGTQTAAWECHNRVLVNRGTYEMGELGTMSGIEIWTWDDKAGKFRTHWFDSFGMTASGTAKYDEETKTWHLKSKGNGPNGRMISEGTITYTDADTLEWTWTEWSSLKLFKIVEMSGTSRRG